MVQRSDDANIPWNTEDNCPADKIARVYRQWVEDGSPVPDPYIPPVLTEWTVPKSVIISRLTDPQLTAFMNAMTFRQTELWRSPDAPNILNHDEEIISLLEGAGADPNVVLAQV